MFRLFSKNRKQEVTPSCPLPFALCLLFFCLLFAPVEAASTLENYTRRVEEAAKLARDVVENDYSQEEERELLLRLTDLVPPTEDVAREGQDKDLTHIDNAWLQQAVEKLASEDEDTRYTRLSEIADRLAALGRSLRSALEQQVTSEANTPREQLQKILARSEYQPETEKDSAIQAWLKKIRQKISELMAKLFFGNSSKTTPSPGSLQVIRWLIIAALVASLVWATILLVRRFRLRQAQPKEDGWDDEVREILGEQLDADVTADDLLRHAAEMARKGEYRLAIRRAYLALLYEMEQRGQLRLHRAKTNRDYLNELKNRPHLYPTATVLTNSYERVWYGFSPATPEDYARFIDKYRELAQ